MFHSITTAADLLTRLRAETSTPAHCDALADLIHSRAIDGVGGVDGMVVTPPPSLASKDDLVAFALAAFLNDGHVGCWEVGSLTGEFEWEVLYSVGAYVLADRGTVHLPRGVRLRVFPILEISDLCDLSPEGEHLLVNVATDDMDITFAHSDAVLLPPELRELPAVPDYMLPRDEFEEADAAFHATLAARGVMAGVLQFLRGVELSAGPLLALIRRGEWRVAM